MNIRLVPNHTQLRFISLHKLAMIMSLILAIGSVGLFFSKGLNFGIDFKGGILLEIKTEGQADISGLRKNLGNLGLGEVGLQEFGAENDVLIRLERQPGDAKAQMLAVDKVKERLSETVSGNIEYRRVEFVGPQVSEELVEAGVTAVVAAVLAILVYIWFRFEWQFGVGAVVALAHDVLLTIGVFSITGMEFNLSIVAAILTIAGYSINDTVVVYDRVRENLRKFRKMALGDVLDLSINETLSRTVMTSLTTLLALIALFIFGGEVMRGFTFAMIWGVVVGTYSSVFLASPILLYIEPKRTFDDEEGEGGKKVEQQG